jgi:hypothetical protein
MAGERSIAGEPCRFFVADFTRTATVEILPKDGTSVAKLF